MDIKKIEMYVGTVTILTEKNIIIFSRKDNDDEKRKVVNSVKNNSRTLIKGFSNCGKTHLMNYIQYQQQESIL